MVFDLILLLIALIGSSIAAIYDLKTTEVPDWVFYVMFGIGFPIVAVKSFISSDFSPVVSSTITGVALLGFGLLMYKTGQWGGADAVLLGIIGFLIPQIPSGITTSLLFPFPVTFLINLFILGTAYMILYSIYIAAKNDAFKSLFVKDLKASSKLITILSVSLFLVFSATTFYLQKLFLGSVNIFEIISASIIPLVLTIVVVLVYKFAVLLEKNVFRKRILVSKLKIGDVLLKKREIVGIDKKELIRIKKSGEKYVWIKEGISFIPAFVIALLFTLVMGDAIMFLIPFKLLI